MRTRVSQARVGRLATVSHDGLPHLVPICFALVDETLVTAVDAKPKRAGTLRRVANVAATGRAALLVDEYSEDWQRLWWVRVDGRGHILIPDEAVEQMQSLVAKYPQYADQPPPGPVIELTDLRWSAWEAAASRPSYRRSRLR